ncbi:dephospho-CoA kinase domain-containing protein-like [Antedon mediterranea]|uniref:dephospho-CoA kinase domain-containing protein-like n=1 Tax=Antedon mediterranea TaxID=105859 RepID=UPI003AF97FC5
MFLVGLTGGIASGKSTVSTMLAKFGCPIIDADVIARQVVEPNTPAWRLIVKHFGHEFLLADRTIDRPKLAACIFGDEKKRKLLNSCTHPFIQKEMMWQVFVNFIKGHQFVILDIPLLLEGSKLLKYIHRVVVVYCNGTTQIQRLMQRNNLSEEDALKRIKSQMNLEEKKQMADFVIENSYGLEETKQQVERLLCNLRHSKAHLLVRVPLIMILIFISLISIIFIYYYA